MVYVGANSDNKYKFRQFFLKRNLEVPDCATTGFLLTEKAKPIDKDRLCRNFKKYCVV